MAQLGDICKKGTSGIAQKDLDNRDGEYPVYGASGFLKDVDFYHQDKPYVAIVKDGAGVGRVMKLPAKSSVIGTMQYIIPNENTNVSYLAYALEYLNLSRFSTGATIPHIYFKDYYQEQLPNHSWIEQCNIADILDKISSLIALRKQQLDRLDELVKARFVEMFGDMLTNPLDWPESPLETMSDIVSGITKGRKTKEVALTEVPYMAVSNVKDGYIDWTTVKTILATESEIKQYRLQVNDILMTEGGDPDKLGRGAIIKEPPDNCIHQNHIFRVRLDQRIILPEFFSEYLQHQKAKQYFLKCAKQTTGIASVNMKQLRSLPVLLPPIEQQHLFLDFKEKINKCKLTIQQGLDKMEIMKRALMQKYFE